MLRHVNCQGPQGFAKNIFLATFHTPSILRPFLVSPLEQFRTLLTQAIATRGSIFAGGNCQWLYLLLGIRGGGGGVIKECIL